MKTRATKTERALYVRAYGIVAGALLDWCDRYVRVPVTVIAVTPGSMVRVRHEAPVFDLPTGHVRTIEPFTLKPREPTVRWMHNGQSLAHAFEPAARIAFCGVVAKDTMWAQWREPAAHFVFENRDKPSRVCARCVAQEAKRAA